MITTKKATTPILIAATLFMVAACNPDPLQKAREDLTEKKEELSTLKVEIDSLQQRIARLDTTQDEVKAPTKVLTKTLQPQHFEHYIEATGTVSNTENLMLSAKMPGEIMEIRVTEGEKVQKGQVLARLDNEALTNQMGEAQAALNMAKTVYERRQKLWDQKIGSEIDFLQSKTNYESARRRLAQLKANNENTFVKSPIKGKVDAIMANTGEFAATGTPIMRVINLDKPEVKVELSEKYLPYVATGDTVQVNLPAIGLRQKATVAFVSSYINPNNRSFGVELAIKNNKGRIKPNLLANVTFKDYQNKEAVVVPSNAIQNDLQGEYVYVAEVINGQTVAAKRRINKGRTHQDETEILEGLAPGDRVVTSGFDQLSPRELIAIQ